MANLKEKQDLFLSKMLVNNVMESLHCNSIEELEEYLKGIQYAIDIVKNNEKKSSGKTIKRITDEVRTKLPE